MPAVDQPRSGRIVGGRYRLGPRRGSGVEVAVFEAVDERLARPVIIKLVHPSLYDTEEEREVLREGVRSSVAIRHNNVGQIFDWGETDWDGHQVMFVVEEHLSGGSLRELLDRGRLLSPSQALLVGLDACRALDAIHRSGGLHGDIRPASLVFGDDRRLRVIDYGLAGPLSAGLFATGGMLSKDRAAYAAPEVAAGEAHQPASDVYSLCISLVEAVTGRLPFMGDSAVATLANRVGKLLPVSADLGPLAPVLERAGRPDPSERSTAAEFGRALMQTAEKLPRPAPIQLLSTGLFSDVVTPGQPVDPSGPLRRDLGATQAIPLVGDSSPAEPALEPPAPDGEPADATAEAAPGTPGADTTESASTDAGSAEIDAAGGADAQGPLIDLGGGPPRQTSGFEATAAHPTVPAPPPAAVTPAKAAGEPPVVDEPTVAVEATRMMPPVAPSAPPAGGGSARPARRGLSRRALAGIVGAILVGGLAISWLATNPTVKKVPDVVGLTQGEALNELKPLGFAALISTEASDDVAAGIVIRTEPEAGAEVDVRVAVQVVISTGPAPRPLPELNGLSFADASAALNGIGLIIEEGEAEYSETVDTGKVIRWVVPQLPNLVAGDTVGRGTAVQVVLSLGPEPRTVPQLGGLTLDEATAKLSELGLEVATTTEVYSADFAAGTVAAQDPVDGATVERGATVTIALSLGPELVAVPELAGLTLEQARVTLANAGLIEGASTGDTTQTILAYSQAGVALSPGATVPKGSTIDLQFAEPPPVPSTTTV
jgi:eukaryotic-like serine/threonine-protein kinase